MHRFEDFQLNDPFDVCIFAPPPSVLLFIFYDIIHHVSMYLLRSIFPDPDLYTFIAILDIHTKNI